MNKIKLILITIRNMLISLTYKPDNNIAIFSFDKNNFKFNSRSLFEYIIDNKKEDFEIKYIINDDAKRNDLIKEYGDYFITTKYKEDIKLISRAKIWITDGGFPLKTPFNHKNRILVNLWHGIPLKKVGLMGYSGINKLRVALTLKMFARHYTLFSSTSDNLAEIYSKSFLIKNSVIKTMGQPRNDKLFEEPKNLSYFIKDIPEYKKIILYAPTWRAGIYGKSWVGEDTQFFPFEDFSQTQLEQFLEENQYLLLLRPHHLQKINISESKWIRSFSSDECEEIMDVMPHFDLLITDYSSIYFDFLLLNKPIIFLPYDIETYQSQVGLNFDYNFSTPGPKPKTQNEFIHEIHQSLTNNEYFQEKRELINNYFNQVKYGSSKLIYDYIVNNLRNK
ncbi:CDP-glycerol glycerophosphotransferase family protein [Morganella morganii]|uniref:CDP-glycerol glycerophosphotransferase family protein n=1 Tax=Morganella morganii TaxID=582 RepID=UPI003A894110